VNKLRITGLLIDKKQKHKCLVLTEEKLDDIGARIEHTPRKSLKLLAQEIRLSTASARTATQLLKPCGVWCTVSARRIVLPMFLMKQLISENTYV
jgi:hypothetical protein